MAATDPLVPGARARALREYVSVPESTNIARLRAFAADMWIALVRRNEIASEKAMEKPGDCKFFSGNTTGVSLQPVRPPEGEIGRDWSEIWISIYTVLLIAPPC